MKNPLCPNGTTSSKIIYKLARREFGDCIKLSSSYVSLKQNIVNALNRMSPKEREENRLDTLVGIEHLKQNDFGKFVSIRFAYWGMMIAITVMIIGTVPIYEYFNMSKMDFGNSICIILTFMLFTIARTTHVQHDELEYLNFKMLCFDDILWNKKKSE